MFWDVVFWIGLIVSAAIGFVYFRDLGDVSQMVLKVRRENMIRFIRNEYRLIAVGLGAATVMAVAHLALGGGLSVVFWIAAVLIAFLYGFPYVWVHVGLRNQKDSARYYSIDEARDYVSPSSQVLVIENNGVARAHPQAQLLRPHLAGNNQGLDGENVVMTFCAMANLGIGYTPEVEGEALDLQVLAQHGNNLILRDNCTGEPIQQIYGTMEGQPERGMMKEWATVRMPLASFEQLYPDGRVFVNEIPGFSEKPLVAFWDRLTRHVPWLPARAGG